MLDRVFAVILDRTARGGGRETSGQIHTCGIVNLRRLRAPATNKSQQSFRIAGFFAVRRQANRRDRPIYSAARYAAPYILKWK